MQEKLKELAQEKEELTKKISEIDESIEYQKYQRQITVKKLKLVDEHIEYINSKKPQ